jgi:DNA-binding NarL/FixJ family response regulator
MTAYKIAMSKYLDAEGVRRATRDAAKQRRQALLAMHKKGKNYAQIGKELGLSRQRVSILVGQAMRD